MIGYPFIAGKNPKSFGGKIISTKKSIDGLGRVRYELRPERLNLLAGLILATLAMGVCVSLIRLLVIEIPPIAAKLPWHSERGWNWFGVGMCLCTTAISAALSGFLFWWITVNWSLVVTVCESGFEWRTRHQVKQYLWDEMTLVREIDFEEELPLTKGPIKFMLPTQKVKIFSIQFKDGTALELTPNALYGHDGLGRVAKREAIARGIPTQG